MFRSLHCLLVFTRNCGKYTSMSMQQVVSSAQASALGVVPPKSAGTADLDRRYGVAACEPGML